MSTSAEDLVLFDRPAPHVAVVTLNRPAARNAINKALAERLEAIVDRIEADDDIWVAILASSNDRVFCAGADLAELSAGVAGMNTKRGGFAGFVEFDRQKPWIAAVRGSALGGGCELSLACDLIVASEASSFGLPEVKRSLIAGAGGVWRLPRALPKHLAFELIATGGSIDAAKAYALGLVNRVAADSEVLATAIELANAIIANGPLAVRESFKIARASVEMAAQEMKAMTAEAYARLSRTADYREGPIAFLEKRPPVWVGR